MLNWAITFLVVAIISALLGFGGIAGISMDMARIVFVVALVLFLVSALAHVLRGGKGLPPV